LFDHQSFTGRSGTFYKYEGLGCIYWHMVSKLLLSIGENINNAVSKNASKETLNRFILHYRDVKHGIGAHKSPADYGSFPFDPYSHTPKISGVQQPGMTGQVKEDIISRFFELGIIIREGILKIQPIMLRQEEFIVPSGLTQPEYAFPYLLFTYCSVPFVYLMDGTSGIEIAFKNSEISFINSYSLSIEQSQLVFNRDASVKKIIVHFMTLS